MHRTPRLLLMLAIAVVTPGLACTGPPRRVRADEPRRDEPPPTAEELAERVKAVLRLHNETRAGEKLNSLEVSPKLTKAAQGHAEDMARRKKMGHEGSDGSTPAERVERAGYRYKRAGENVAFGRFTPEALMDVWMASPPHRKNILGSFSQIGVACATDEDGRTYWCVTFGLPARP